MKFLVPGAIAALAGTTLAFALVIVGTGLAEQNTRPEVDQSEQASRMANGSANCAFCFEFLKAFLNSQFDV